MAGIRDLKGDKFRYIPLNQSIFELSTQTSFYSGISEVLVSKLRSAVQIWPGQCQGNKEQPYSSQFSVPAPRDKQLQRTADQAQGHRPNL